MKSSDADKQPNFIQRREFMKSGAVFLSAIAAAPALAKGISTPEPMLRAGVFDDEYGSPSKFEHNTKRKTMSNGNALTPISTQKGIITSASLHFGSHHSGIPTIDPNQHELYIHGLTEKSLRFSLNDLDRYPQTGGIMFLECAGNTWSQAITNDPASLSCTDLYGLISGSEWIGVPVKLLLEEAGIKPNAKWAIVEGSDAGTHSRSIPIEKLMDDAIIAIYQNGERLRPAQGYPMRLFVPGWEGNMSVKYVRRIQLSETPAFTKDESHEYTETLADGSIERFSYYMGVKSVITTPSAGQKLPEKGYYELTGLAWSGFGKISKVEVSDDGGKTWHNTELHAPVLSKSLTRFSLPWKWQGQEVRLQSRAYDDFGNVQPTHAEWTKRYKKGSYHHYNAVQTWKVALNGGVTNVL